MGDGEGGGAKFILPWGCISVDSSTQIHQLESVKSKQNSSFALNLKSLKHDKNCLH